MKNFIGALVLFFSFNFGAQAQTGKISGSLKEIDSLSPIAGAFISLDGKNAISNGVGHFSFDKLSEGKHVLLVRNLGYFPITRIITLKPGEVQDLSLYLLRSVANLSQITVTGAQTKNTPGSAFYLSPKEIQRFNYTDINRTLRSVPGINMQEEDGFGLRPNIGLRGTGVERSSKITIMEDGVLMAPAPYSAPAAYYFPTIGRMQSVEILKGSSQIKYGPYTTGGAINLISLQIPDKFSGGINLTTGSFGSKNSHAFVGNSHENFGYLVESFQYSSGGFKQLSNGNSTGFDKKDYLAKFRLNTKSTAKVYQSLTIKAGLAQEQSNETYLGLTESDFASNPYHRYLGSDKDNMQTEQHQLSLTHLIKFNKSMSLTTTAYYTDFKRNWYKLDKIVDSSGTAIKIGDLLNNPDNYSNAYSIITGNSGQFSNTLNVKANNRSYGSKGIQSLLSYKLATKDLFHKIEYGIRLHQDGVDRFQWVDDYYMNNGVMMLVKQGTKGTESNRVETANAIATFAQYTLKWQKLTITPGLRYENILLSRLDYGKSDPNRTGIDLSERENQVDVFIPGAGINYEFNKKISSFIGLHKGFAPPGSQEGTLPEESINYEIGTRFSKQSLFVEAIMFYNDYNNLLGSDLASSGGQGTNLLFNGGAVNTVGLEFQLSYNILAPFSKSKFSMPFNVTYTYTDSKFQNSFDSEFEGWGEIASGDEFPYLSNHQFSANIGLEHYRFSLSFSTKYQSEMRTTPGQGEISAVEKIDSFITFDASINYNLHNNLVLFGSGINLSNASYVVAKRPAGLRPGMPRAFNIGVKAKF